MTTLYITVPAVTLTLFLSSCMAFVLARFSFKLILTLLGVVAAGSVVVALPPPIVFFILQKQFVSGLTLGATKG